MTRYITRSEYTDNKYLPRNIRTSNRLGKYGITQRDVCLEVMYIITGLRFNPLRLIEFIENFYDYREFLSYNSRVYVINLFVSKHIHDLENFTINGKRLYRYSPKEICAHVPLVVLLSNDDTIMPIPISTIYDHNDYYNISNHNYYHAVTECSIDIGKDFYTISEYDIGSGLFYCDYTFDDDNTIYMEPFIGDIKITPELLDFISVNKPSLDRYMRNRIEFIKYKIHKFHNYIETNINSIVSENSPPELVKIFNELVPYELVPYEIMSSILIPNELVPNEKFEPKYMSLTQIKKELERKRIQELVQARKRIKELKQEHKQELEQERKHIRELIEESYELEQELEQERKRIQELEQELDKLKNIINT